jgi:tryptophanase
MGTGVIEMVEPYRIKVVESIPRITRAARLKALSTAGFNTFARFERAAEATR